MTGGNHPSMIVDLASIATEPLFGARLGGGRQIFRVLRKFEPHAARKEARPTDGAGNPRIRTVKDRNTDDRKMAENEEF